VWPPPIRSLWSLYKIPGFAASHDHQISLSPHYRGDFLGV